MTTNKSDRFQSEEYLNKLDEKSDLKDFLYNERILFYNLLIAEVARQNPEEKRSFGYDKLAEKIISHEKMEQIRPS